jgi:hypothetical protein
MSTPARRNPKYYIDSILSNTLDYADSRMEGPGSTIPHDYQPANMHVGSQGSCNSVRHLHPGMD